MCVKGAMWSEGFKRYEAMKNKVEEYRVELCLRKSKDCHESRTTKRPVRRRKIRLSK